MFYKWLNLIYFIILVSPLSKTLSQHPNLNREIHLGVKNMDVAQLLEEISHKANVYFSYNSGVVNDSVKVSIDSGYYTVKEVLQKAFPSPYRFDEFENHVILLNGNQKNFRPGDYHKNEPNKNRVILSGKVMDSRSKAPIAFAHVVTDRDYQGTISNQSGAFTLKLENPMPGDSIIVSCIGYEKYTRSLESIKSPQQVLLTPSTFKLKEIHVMPNSPTFIIEQALIKTGENYSRNPAILTAFFRESNQLNNQFLSLSEAIISIYKTPYQQNYRKDKVQLIKGRKNQNFEPLENYNIKVAGGLYYNLKLDIAKETPSFINPEYFHFYDYRFDTSTHYHGREAYVIRFDQKDWVQDAMFKGKLYIDIETKAIAGASYEISPKGLDHASAYMVQKKPLSYRIRPVHTHYLVHYRFFKGKWHLNNAKSEIMLRIYEKKEDKASIFSSTSEFLITSRIEEDIHAFSFNNSAGAHDVFVEQINEYDEDFWGPYTIIEPGKSLKDAYHQLNENKTIFLVNKALKN